MKKLNALVISLVLLISKPVMAGFLDDLKDVLENKGRKVSSEDIKLQPQKYCIKYFERGELISAIEPCRYAAKEEPSFYYYVAMINYLKYPKNLELNFGYLKSAKQALEGKQDVESKQKLAMVYLATATLFEKHAPEAWWSDKNYYDVAKERYEKALALAEETDEKFVKALAATHLGGYYVENSDLKKAEMYLQKAEKAWGEVKEIAKGYKDWVIREKIKFYRNLGVLAYQKKNYAEAEENFQEVLRIAGRNFSSEDLYEYWAWFGVWLYRMGKYDEAESYIKKAIDRMELWIKEEERKRFGWQPSEDILINLATWYEDLADVYIKKNDLEQAKMSLMRANNVYAKTIAILKKYEKTSGDIYGVGATAKERYEIEGKIKANEKKIKELKARGNQ
jgi:tetratricopeptide (TPR) repeat protein